MQKNLSIRWHSRAGQGAITASTALAEIMGNQGKFVQSFPDFGAEKRGASVTAYNRICEKVTEDVSHPTEIDVAILLDTTLISNHEITNTELSKNLKKDSALLINTSQKVLKNINSEKIFAINASEIALKEIGKDIPNVPILGALVRILNLSKLKDFSQSLAIYLSSHLPAEVVKGNLRAFEHGFNEVREITSEKNKVKNTSKSLPSWRDIPLAATIRKNKCSDNYDTGNWTRRSCKWNSKSCINCSLCWPVCPHDAIKTDSQGNMTGVDEAKCTACGLCVTVCPTKPKSLALVEKQEVSI